MPLHRRAFLASTAAVAVAPFVRPGLATAADPIGRTRPSHLKLSIAAYSYRQFLQGDKKSMDLFDFADLAADMGLDAIEINDGIIDLARCSPSTPCPYNEDGYALYVGGVDHSPSYLWNSATWEISAAILPFLRTVLEGPEAWSEDPAISNAIEITDGVIRNPSILSFQGRGAEYPHLFAP